MKAEFEHPRDATFVDYIGFAQDYARRHPGETIPEITQEEVTALYEKAEQILMVFGQTQLAFFTQHDANGKFEAELSHPYLRTPEMPIQTSAGPLLMYLEEYKILDDALQLEDVHIQVFAGTFKERTETDAIFYAPKLLCTIRPDGLVDMLDLDVDPWFLNEVDTYVSKHEEVLSLSDFPITE